MLVAKSSNALNVSHQPQKHLAETQEAKQACESWRSQLGDALIKRYEPVFRRRPSNRLSISFDRVFVFVFSWRQLQQHQSTLTTERQRIAGFTERAAAVPGTNEGSLNGNGTGQLSLP